MVRASFTDFPAHRFRKPRRSRTAAGERRADRPARQPFRRLADRFGGGAHPLRNCRGHYLSLAGQVARHKAQRDL